MYMNTVIAAAIIGFVAATPVNAAPADTSIEAREPILLRPGMHQMNVPHGANGQPLFRIGKREAHIIRPELGETAHPVYRGGRVLADKSVVHEPIQARDAEAQPEVIFPELGQEPHPVSVGGRILSNKGAVRRPILPRDAEAEATRHIPGTPFMNMPHGPDGRLLAYSKVAARDAADEMQVQRTRFQGHRPILPREAEAQPELPLPSYLHHNTGPHRTGGIRPIMARDDAADANDQLASLVSGLQRRSMPIEIDDEPELARRDDANDANDELAAAVASFQRRDEAGDVNDQLAAAVASLQRRDDANDANDQLAAAVASFQRRDEADDVNDQLAAAVASLQRRSPTLEPGLSNFHPHLTIPIYSPSERSNPFAHETFGTPKFTKTQTGTDTQNAKRDDDAAADANEQLAAFVSGFN